jgi:predicted DNA-binding protein (MmcQ/YjbR family)
MDLIEFREYCLRKPFVSEGFPFDQKTLVFKVDSKIYVLLDCELFAAINVKLDPERGIELRESFQAVQPGYHMNKKHWNTVALHADVSDEMVYTLVDESYELVYRSLTKKRKDALAVR